MSAVIPGGDVDSDCWINNVRQVFPYLNTTKLAYSPEPLLEMDV
jgi:hypothetical protein